MPFQFSLRDLLAVITVLGLSFAWPVAFWFTIPLLIAAILSRLGIGDLAPAIVAVALALGIGALISWGYWGYPFYPPRMLSEIRSVKVLQRVSSFTSLNLDEKHVPTPYALFSLPPESSLDWNTPTELFATHRILQEFARRKLRIQSQAPVSTEVLVEAWQITDDLGILLDGSPERTNTKTLIDGYVAFAELENGAEVIVLTAMGDEFSNDHYPYYEWVFKQTPDGLVLIDSQQFFFDISGVEGLFTGASMAVMAFILALPLTYLFWAILRGSREAAIGPTGALQTIL